LKSKKIVEDSRVEEPDVDKAKAIVEACAPARLVHSTLNIVSSRDYPCSTATVAMAAFAKEHDFKEGQPMFDYSFS
jgi:hypothetical protein